MDSPPKRDQLPLKQLLVLGLIGIVILIALLSMPDKSTYTMPLPVTFNQGVNLRMGPSTKFNPPIGSYGLGQTAQLIAKDLTGDWYEVTSVNGKGWVFAQFVTFSGDISRIPIDAGPPIPADTPVPATLVPDATPSQPTANLVLGNVRITPDIPLKCGKPAEFKIDIANLGLKNSEAEGQIVITDYWNGQEQASASGTFPIIEPGKTINVGGIFLIVSTDTDEDHKLVITVNPGGVVLETTHTDNSREIPYKLQPC